jgi:hypothetical protein
METEGKDWGVDYVGLGLKGNLCLCICRKFLPDKQTDRQTDRQTNNKGSDSGERDTIVFVSETFCQCLCRVKSTCGPGHGHHCCRCYCCHSFCSCPDA